jgi:hypothetical protein
MALYLVRAKPKKELSDLRKEMDSGKILKLRPFGETLQHSLENARIDKEDGYALWVEEDYCLPPLAMERESVLDRYFNDIVVERIELEEERGVELMTSLGFGENNTENV